MTTESVTVGRARHGWTHNRISRVLAAIATIGIVFDAVATYLAVEVFRVGQEVNPVILWMAEETNFAVAMVLRIIGGIILIAVFMLLIHFINTHREKLLAVYALGLAALMLTLLSCWHIFIIISQLSVISDFLS